MRTFVSMLAAVALLGCAASEGVRPKWTLREGDFAWIRPGTTKSEIQTSSVGKPIMTMVLPRVSEEVWDYRYMQGVETRVAEIHFDMQGRVKYLTTYRDKCSFGPIGCR